MSLLEAKRGGCSLHRGAEAHVCIGAVVIDGKPLPWARFLERADELFHGWRLLRDYERELHRLQASCGSKPFDLGAEELYERFLKRHSSPPLPKCEGRNGQNALSVHTALNGRDLVMRQGSLAALSLSSRS